MSAKAKSKYMTPFIIGASDLAFILLFFFIMIGSGAQKLEKIEMPFKAAKSQAEVQRSPVRVEIYEETQNSDTSRMALIYKDESTEAPDTLYLSMSKSQLSSPESFKYLKERLSDFVHDKGLRPDSTTIDVYSSVYSYYGLIAITLAACNQLEYPCNLVYRTEES